MGKYLGCQHNITDVRGPPGINPFTGETMPILVGKVLKEPTAVSEAEAYASAPAPNKQGGAKKEITYRCIQYDMSDFISQCVDKYCELANVKRSTPKSVPTPFINDGDTTTKGDTAGTLQPIAARVLMKILYAGRMARYDVLKPVCSLASLITRWTNTCDRMLHRLVCYLNSSLNLCLVSWVGNTLEELELPVSYTHLTLPTKRIV